MASLEEVKEAPVFPREGYAPEWLALEDASGGRYIIVPDDMEAATIGFNTTFAALAKMWPPLEEPLEVWDETTGPSHGNMAVRIYKPTSDTNGTTTVKPLPLMVHIPGGGYFCGNLDTEDHQSRYFAAKTPCLVMSIDYPRAPAYQVDDIIAHCVMAVKWCRQRATSLGASPQTLVAGGSAGALLTAQVAYHFMTTSSSDSATSATAADNDDDDHVDITGCMLLYTGILHWTYSGSEYADMHRGWVDNGHAQVPLFGTEVSARLWANIGIRPDDPRHFIGNTPASKMSRFPPCYLMSAEKDCWRDDGKVMQHILQEAGVKSKYDFYPGLPHWFHCFPQLQVSHVWNEKTVEGARWLLEQKVNA